MGILLKGRPVGIEDDGEGGRMGEEVDWRYGGVRVRPWVLYP